MPNKKNAIQYRVLSWLLKVYMVINFKTYMINQNTRKLACISMLIIKKRLQYNIILIENK